MNAHPIYISPWSIVLGRRTFGPEFGRESSRRSRCFRRSGTRLGTASYDLRMVGSDYGEGGQTPAETEEFGFRVLKC